MELVIKIDEEEYEATKRIPELYRGNLIKAIANGTPLPKGHGRLIDANDVDNHIVGSVDLRDCPTVIEADKG